MQGVSHLNQQNIAHIRFKSNFIMQKASKIEWYSGQIEIDPLNTAFIQSRSDAYVVEGKYDEALSDCSKLILLEPSRQYYVKRSKLLQDRGMFSLAIQDLAEAKAMRKDQLDQTAEDVYLERSICMTNIKEAAEMAQIVEEVKEKTDVSRYSKTLEEMLHIREVKQENQRKQQLQKLKVYYQEQTVTLKELFLNQLNQLKLKMQCTVQNYQQKFAQKLKKLSTLSLPPLDTSKLQLYFQTFSSQMQKYYIAAKNLHKIQDKSIKFQDFQSIVTNNNKFDLVKKVYKFFDKYSTQIQKIISVIHNIPYIGCMFTVIKASLGAKKWVQEVNMEAQCHNIEHVAVNTTSFNEFSTNLAYYVTFHLKEHILASHNPYKSQWEELLLRIKEIKREHYGVASYKLHLSQEMQTVKDYAIIHASTVMVAFACNCLHLNKEDLKQVNLLEEKGEPQPYIGRLAETYRLIAQVQRHLRSTKKQTPKGQKSYCQIC